MKQADFDYVIKRAVDQGWRHQRTGSGHNQFYAPDGKTIVTCGDMPRASEWHADENFMADMRRAGYVHGLSAVGEALAAAIADKKEPNGGAKLSVTQHVVDALARAPDGRTAADLKAIVRSHRPELADNAVYAGLSTLTIRGIVKKSPAGIYQLTDIDRSALKFHTPRPGSKTNGHDKSNGALPQEQLAMEHAPAPLVTGARTGDAAIDTDLEILDRALAALADIEGVVRKNRAVLAQLASLKKVLGL